MLSDGVQPLNSGVGAGIGVGSREEQALGNWGVLRPLKNREELTVRNWVMVWPLCFYDFLSRVGKGTGGSLMEDVSKCPCTWNKIEGPGLCRLPTDGSVAREQARVSSGAASGAAVAGRLMIGAVCLVVKGWPTE